MTSMRASQPVLTRLMVALGCIFAIFGGKPGVATAVAQETSDTSYTLETTGDKITWDAPWEIEPDVTDVSEGFEIVGFTSETSSLLISIIPNDLDLEEARDATLEGVAEVADSFTIVERGAYENISYALDIATYEDGIELGVFTLFRGGSGDTPTFVYVFIGDIASFSEGFRSAQETFRVNDDTIFNGVEGDGLEELLVQSSAGAGDNPVDREATEEPEDEPTREASRSDRETPVDDEYSDLGVVEEGVYESPQFGIEIAWSRDWDVNDNLDEPLVSDPADELDLLNLTDDSDTILSIQIQPAGDVTPAEVVELWTSEEFLDDADAQGTKPDQVVLSESGRDIGSVVQRGDLEDGTELVIVREVQMLDDADTVVILQFIQTVEAFEEALDSAQQGVELEGEPVLSLFDIEEITDELD